MPNDTEFANRIANICKDDGGADPQATALSVLLDLELPAPPPPARIRRPDQCELRPGCYALRLGVPIILPSVGLFLLLVTFIA